MPFRVQQQHGFEYVQQGEGPTVVLLHGLFGALSNWGDVLNHFSDRYRVVIPLMPIYRGKPVLDDMAAITAFVLGFLSAFGYDRVSLVGNSLGGHVGLLVTLEAPQRVETLTLTGSSGLFEHGMGLGYIRRGDYDFIAERVAYTFYDPAIATPGLVDEVFAIVNDRVAALRTLKIARDAQRMNLRQELSRIHAPVCLIWGLNDNITPPQVAHEFHALLPNSSLHFLDHCGHAPMMEHPQTFNELLEAFLEKHLASARVKEVA